MCRIGGDSTLWPILIQAIDDMAEEIVALISTFLIVCSIVAIILSYVYLSVSGGED